MYLRSVLLAAFCILSYFARAQNKTRPNILWLTFEDASFYNFGCYGNTLVHTPNIDSLARNGIQFMNASSVAPQCSPARSTIITGQMATTYGMDFHPRRVNTPDNILFPRWLHNAGYFCTNNRKTDYNTTTNHSNAWDENGTGASYNSKNRQPGQPFFSVFNSEASHMGVARSMTIEGRRDYSKEGIYVNKAVLPPYMPDLPEIRSDYGAHLEGIQSVDEWVGAILKNLQENNLSDNTIIFIFSDHGGVFPRSKGYIYQTGLHPPLIMYIPPALRAGIPGGLPRKENRMVDFTDLAPTVLSLAGVKPEQPLAGISMLDEKKLSGRKYQFAFATNQLHHFNPCRSVNNGRYKLIRSYVPYKPFALRNYYQWGMPSNMAWDNLILQPANEQPVYEQPYQRRPAELLFDLEKDPYETKNLAHLPEYKATLTDLRDTLSAHIRATKDVGFFDLADRTGKIVYNEIRTPGFPLNDYFNLIERAGLATKKDLPLFQKFITHERAVMRYWASVGLAQLAVNKQLAGSHVAALERALHDKDPYVAAEAAFALVYAGNEKQGLARLLAPLPDNNIKIGLSLLECISLDTDKKQVLMPITGELKKLSTISSAENEDPAFMARGILVNLGQMTISDMYGEQAHQAGMKINQSKRNMGPSPNAPYQPNKQTRSE